MTNEKSDNDDDCGKYDFESEPNISWEVLVEINNGGTCGGVAVSKEWILTNAECGKSVSSLGGSIRNQGNKDFEKMMIFELIIMCFMIYEVFIKSF